MLEIWRTLWLGWTQVRSRGTLWSILIRYGNLFEWQLMTSLMISICYRFLMHLQINLHEPFGRTGFPLFTVHLFGFYSSLSLPTLHPPNQILILTSLRFVSEFSWMSCKLSLSTLFQWNEPIVVRQYTRGSWSSIRRLRQWNYLKETNSPHIMLHEDRRKKIGKGNED